MAIFRVRVSLFMILACVPSWADADGVNNAEDAASYFESFLAQTAEWGEYDLELEHTSMREALDSSAISEISIRERYLRTDDMKIFVRSVLLTPILGDETAKPSHRLTATVLQLDGNALQREYPRSADRFDLDEEKTFDWACNPTDLRLLGLAAFPCPGGGMSEAILESLRQRACVPNPLRKVAVLSDRAVVSSFKQRPGASVQGKTVFDLDRLLISEREWKLEAGEILHQGKESFTWEMIDGRYRPSKVTGSEIKTRQNKDNKQVRHLDHYDAVLTWRPVDKKLLENPNRVLNDVQEALKFLGLSEETKIEPQADR